MVLCGYRIEIIDHLKSVFKRTGHNLDEFYVFWEVQALPKKMKKGMWIQKYQIGKQSVLF